MCSFGSTGGGYKNTGKRLEVRGTRGDAENFYKAEEVQHVTVIPIDSHTAFYFPPGRLLWPSADNQIVQTVSPETCGASFPTKRTQNICMLSGIPTKWNQL